MTKDITKKDFISVILRKTLKPRYLFISFGFWKSKKHQQIKLADVIKANGWDLSCLGYGDVAYWKRQREWISIKTECMKFIHSSGYHELLNAVVCRTDVFPKPFWNFFLKIFRNLFFTCCCEKSYLSHTFTFHFCVSLYFSLLLNHFLLLQPENFFQLLRVNVMMQSSTKQLQVGQECTSLFYC